ncbi:hypothetical protein [Roseateles noduli]|uniref:hypothetical protein n=1 Tax=Roseateles noduli TaxID=2052484 RepID=UPI003D656B75
MKPLRLRFSAPWRQRLGAGPVAMGVLLGALACLGHELWTTLRLDAQLREQRIALAAAQAPRPAAGSRAASAPGIPAIQVVAANAAIRRLNLPWREVFDGLEAAAGEQVSVVSIEPEADKRLLQVGGEVATPDRMLDFVSRLKRLDAFEQVVLRHHEVASSGPSDARPLKFIVAVTWRDPQEAAR